MHRYQVACVFLLNFMDDVCQPLKVFLCPSYPDEIHLEINKCMKEVFLKFAFPLFVLIQILKTNQYAHLS